MKQIIYNGIYALCFVVIMFVVNIMQARVIPAWWYLAGFLVLFIGYSANPFRKKRLNKTNTSIQQDVINEYTEYIRNK